MAIRNILFIELMGGIGDLVIALPAIRALACSHPQAKISVLTFYPGGTLLEDLPYVAEVIYATSGKSQTSERCPQRKDVEKLLAERSFDVIVSNTMYGGIDLVVENSTALYKVSNLWRHPPEDQLIGDRFVRILQSEGLIEESDTELHTSLVVSEANKRWANLWLQGNIHGNRPFAILNPDTGMPIKRWMPHNFVKVGKWLASERGLWILVPVGEQRQMSTSIAREIGSNAIVFPRARLTQFLAIAARAALLVSPDTGPARIASAAGVPTIALYGPTSAGRYGLRPPYPPAPQNMQGSGASVVNIQSPRHCAERKPWNFTLQSCWYSGVCIFHDIASCVDDITPGAVIQAAQKLLDSNSGQ